MSADLKTSDLTSQFKIENISCIEGFEGSLENYDENGNPLGAPSSMIPTSFNNSKEDFVEFLKHQMQGKTSLENEEQESESSSLLSLVRVSKLINSFKREDVAAADQILNECRELGANDKLFQLQRLAKTYQDLYPRHFETHQEELGPLLRESEEALFLLNQFKSMEGWNLILEKDVNVWHRQLQEDRHIHGLRTDYVMEADMNSVLVLLNEIGLYKRWLPFVEGAEELERQSRCSSIAWVKIWSPPPLKPRDLCVHGRAIDGLDEDGCTVLILKAVNEEELGLERPSQAQKNTVRMEMKITVIQFIPVERNKTRIRTLSYADPQLPFTDVPSWLLNFICSNMARIGLKMWESHGQAIAQKKKGKSEHHRKRMKENPEFYQWMEERVQTHFLQVNALNAKKEEETGGQEDIAPKEAPIEGEETSVYSTPVQT
mmetsp:Transcript_22560/g.29537  ORF Transcript_22560/g.29537 Transcript_22560/m.29537 type:complete len:432 (+) Transcript_22560:118-1413(+)|eukprot:CAMPEP_0117752108 /NCGR_PEP_ID=MMETSP0947-20121206/11406_1 /TAXON_ID=44440 /ORGANISM="Chattonella subsalsa, Strain CCMP2191" /LENGTH=431 /DNA_ID=CAMNT_0005570681 /DNA_START=118 /DNA_END=1413 /DNA_ORIENTATION=-